MSEDLIDYHEKTKEFKYDEDGKKHWGVLLGKPYEAFKANKIKDEVDDYLDKKFPKDQSRRNNVVDAYRHTLWSYKMTRKFGEKVAKDFGDAHEREIVNTKGETLMDLHNNKIGRELALNRGNHRYKDEAVIEFAHRNGYLKTDPYKVLGEYSSFKREPDILHRRGFTATGQMYNDR